VLTSGGARYIIADYSVFFVKGGKGASTKEEKMYFLDHPIRDERRFAATKMERLYGSRDDNFFGLLVGSLSIGNSI
jgi:hypothetical protein